MRRGRSPLAESAGDDVSDVPAASSQSEAEHHRQDEEKRRHPDEHDAFSCLRGEPIQLVISFTLHAYPIPRWADLGI
jgi:hypothetical protein